MCDLKTAEKAKCKICKMTEGFHGVLDGDRFIPDFSFMCGQGDINSTPVSVTLDKYRVCNVCRIKLNKEGK